MKIEGTFSGELDIKRCYLPGVTLTDTCKKCGHEVTNDYESEYLSYPKVGTPTEISLYCPTCNFDWRVQVLLNLTLTPA